MIINTYSDLEKQNDFEPKVEASDCNFIETSGIEEMS